MFQRLVNHNSDLESLLNKGYAIAIDSTNYLVIRDIPYIDSMGALAMGALVSKIDYVDEIHVQQTDHQMYFAGTHPHNLDGSEIRNLGGGTISLVLSELCTDIKVERIFSNKLMVGGALTNFRDLFEKVEHYVSIICGPAIEKFGVSPLTFRPAADLPEDSIFKFRDTLTSRAGIAEFASIFEDEVVAVIGLGGTGSYILDFLVKTRIGEIRAFDGDQFQVHNAFRAPGYTNTEEFGKSKAEVLGNRYSNFRHSLIIKKTYIDETSSDEITGVTFAFVCVDKGSSRAKIFKLLVDAGIPFIDVGMGVNKREDGVSGQLRTTYLEPNQAMRRINLQIVPLEDGPENLYRTNIQISELNALNAAIAVIKYKQQKGFYSEETKAYQHIFSVPAIKTFEGENGENGA